MENAYEVDHVGFVVFDVERSSRMLSEYLGIKEWVMRTYEPPMLYDQTLHGQPVNHSYKIAIGSLKGMGIELLMPLKGESVYSEVLREKGESVYQIHHICLVFPNDTEFEKKQEELTKKGGKVIQSGKIRKPQGIGQYSYIEKDGVVLELTIRK